MRGSLGGDGSTGFLLLCLVQCGSLTLETDSLFYLVAAMRDRNSSVTVYPEGMIIRNPRTWKPPIGTHTCGCCCCCW